EIRNRRVGDLKHIEQSILGPKCDVDYVGESADGSGWSLPRHEAAHFGKPNAEWSTGQKTDVICVVRADHDAGRNGLPRRSSREVREDGECVDLVIGVNLDDRVGAGVGNHVAETALKDAVGVAVQGSAIRICRGLMLRNVGFGSPLPGADIGSNKLPKEFPE